MTMSSFAMNGGSFNGRFSVTPELARDLRRWQIPALLVGITLLVASAIGAFFQPDEFFRSYLFAYLFWIGIALGSMAIVMTQYLTGGAWGVVTRRTLESAMRTLPLLIVLFVPIVLGIPRLYHWSHPNLVKADEVMLHRSSYMNEDGFVLRAVAYFVIWLIFAYFLNKWSREEDDFGGRRKLLARISAPGLILYVFTVTFSSVDWAESLADHWFSTMWGFLFVAGQGLAALCFAILVISLLSRRKPMSEALLPSHFLDLGKLTLMFLMLWAYFQFSQLLIVWSGNLSNEIPWYMPRFATTWHGVGSALIWVQFLVPFLLLLSRPLKRNRWTLCVIVIWLLLMRFVDMFWIVMPQFHLAGFHVSWLNFSVPLALGGIWVATFLWQLQKRPLLPLQDPSLEEALHHGE
jgi:hypothetical protein